MINVKMAKVLVLEALVRGDEDGHDHVIGVFLNDEQVKIAITSHGKMTDGAYVYRTAWHRIGELKP